jgi:murein DD-endopeptidase MepM/ murein hydrolase activator NlpD
VKFRVPHAYPLHPISAVDVPPGEFRVTRSFGDMSFPQHGPHDGLDVGNGRTHDPILAMAPGTVTQAAFDPNSGGAAIVRIDHGDGWSSGYAHMDRIDVSQGQRVSEGTQVGILGSTGWVSGAHLHFDITRNGVRLDPWPLLTLEEAMQYVITAEINERWRTVTGQPFYTIDGTRKAWADPVEVVSSAYEVKFDGAGDKGGRLVNYHGDPLLVPRLSLDPTGERIDSAAVHAAVR